MTGGEGTSSATWPRPTCSGGADAYFARFEEVQKSGHELVLPELYADRKFLIGSYTAGYIRDLAHGKGTDMGVGVAVTVSPRPVSLDPFYGKGSAPVGFQIMFRMRPSRMKGMAGMKGRGMSGTRGTDGAPDGSRPQAPAHQPMPGMSMP